MRLEITRPDDWHLHLRDGAALQAVVADSARLFRRAIIMPNLRPPVTDTAQAADYHGRILAALPAGSDFEPLMTLYLTDHTSVEEIQRAQQSGLVHACKLYPAGATTNSAEGVTAIERLDPVFAAMAELGLPLLVHGEVTAERIDIFDREGVFIEQVLSPLHERHPRLKIVFEHITTAEAAAFVLQADDQVAATITAHHLLLNRNAILAGGIRPHHYCLPVLKRERHRQALLEAVASGSPKFFLGTDSAPHSRSAKESACGCAGMYTAFAALELYAEAFASVDALDHLEAFASFNGPDFYALPRNSDKVVLEQESGTIAATLPYGDEELIPFRAGGQLEWRGHRG